MGIKIVQQHYRTMKCATLPLEESKATDDDSSPDSYRDSRANYPSSCFDKLSMTLNHLLHILLKFVENPESQYY